jgi:manganese transport protein
VHREGRLSVPPIKPTAYARVALALDFSKTDPILLSHALGQAAEQSHFILIHVVESVSARVYGQESDDLETRKDLEQLELYAAILRQQGHTAESRLGFKRRTKEIVRLVKETNAGLLVIGAHGHSGIKDWLYGSTIDTVRHGVKIPILIVRA